MQEAIQPKASFPVIAKTGPTKVKVKEESIYYTISFYIENDLVYVLVDFKISPVDMYHYR